jgi:hypothetical protein
LVSDEEKGRAGGSKEGREEGGRKGEGKGSIFQSLRLGIKLNSAVTICELHFVLIYEMVTTS